MSLAEMAYCLPSASFHIELKLTSNAIIQKSLYRHFNSKSDKTCDEIKLYTSAGQDWSASKDLDSQIEIYHCHGGPYKRLKSESKTDFMISQKCAFIPMSE